MALPLIFVVVGGQAFRIAATTAGKKIVQQLLKRGGKKVTEQAAKKVNKSPVTVTVQNIAKVLKDTRVKPSNMPKPNKITKPKPNSAAPKLSNSASSRQMLLLAGNAPASKQMLLQASKCWF